MAVVGGSAVVGVDGQAFSSERGTGIVRRDRQRVEGRRSRWGGDTPGRLRGARRLKSGPWEGDERGGERRRTHRSFDSASFGIRNRWPPRSLLRGRIRGKDHGCIGFRIRTPPRDGSVRFGSLDDLGLLRLSGITPNVHPKFPCATSHAAFKDDVIRVKVVDSPDVFLHLCHGGAPPPVDIQNADQESVDLVGNW